MLLDKIRMELNDMSRVERKIAELLLSDPMKFMRMSMADVAQQAHVSQGSVNNFSRRYADGFPGLKMQLALGAGQLSEPPIGGATADEGVTDIMRSSLDGIMFALRHTIALNREEDLESVARRIMKARRILICGIFSSGAVAQSLSHWLMLMGLPSECCTDVLMCPVIATTLDENCLIIAVSSSGSTKDIYDTLAIARECNVPCVCITRNPHGTITALCETTLLVSTGSAGSDRRADLIRMSEYFLIDCLCAYIRCRMNEYGTKRYERQTQILKSHSMEE